MTSPAKRRLLRAVFRRGSTTFYWTSRLFSRAIRDDVEALYAYVRLADDCVDELPADPQRLDALESGTGLTPDDAIVYEAFTELAARHAFDQTWTAAFFRSMRADLHRATYATLEDTLDYVYGSAEVIGLMMARVMRAPEDALPGAALLGRAFQYINMIRDIGVDQALGRTYLPASELARHGLTDLSEQTARAHPAAFAALVRNELALYRAWQAAGAARIGSLPFACRPAVRAACAAYARTADAVEADPLCVYDGAYKPSRTRILWGALTTTFRP